MKSRNILLALCAIVAVGTALWIGRYPALYYVYLWRLDHTTGGPLILATNDRIESISPHIIPLLVHTYENVDASEKSRHAAALGLIESDRNEAESLFIGFLENKDDEIVATAIFDLGIAKSDKPFKTIMRLAHHPNKRIRWAVADYLGHLSNTESISLLKQMTNDPEGDVRSWARYQLKLRGVLPEK
ncbi:HEAT repeat domain-containing protein [Candidatus Poribacteria bacterium]|nr:HEAT repeat domain-containing protein [Candidatus Poribacteria bacterium]